MPLLLFAFLAFLFETGLALAFELVLDGCVLKSFLLDLLQLDHLGFSRRLEVGERVARIAGLGLAGFEIMASGVKPVDRLVILICANQLRSRRRTKEDQRRRFVVAVVHVGEQHQRILSRADKLSNRRVGQAGSQSVHLRLEFEEVSFRRRKLDRQGVQSGFGVEHCLGGGVCPVAGIEDFTGGLFRLGAGVLGGRQFGRQREQSDNGRGDK